MAQQKKPTSGFALPDPATASATADASAPVTAATEMAVAPENVVVINTASRDMLIGGAVLLVLYIAFFFAKNAYANGLVAKRLPPNKANASGWWLFIFLASIATGVVLATANRSMFMAPLVMGPVVLVALVALVLTFTSSRK
jgi:hypothetical protein